MLLVSGALCFCSIALLTATTHARPKNPLRLEIQRIGLSGPCTYLALQQTQLHKDLFGDDVVVESGTVFRGEHHHHVPGEDETYIRYFSFDAESLWVEAEAQCGSYTTWSFSAYIAPDLSAVPRTPQSVDAQIRIGIEPQYTAVKPLPPAPNLEITPLIITGPSSNRIDFVFFGDGYTREEKEKFIKDANKLALDVSNNQTFATVKPLLNFWAAFTPSNESGIGVGGEAKDTVYGLYRDGTELRGVYYAKPYVAHAACVSMGDTCDYPILLGNDPLYGGLGGTFTVTTSSEINGALVLRHELGHSVIREGEEYDGGFAYYGPNAANLTDPFPWAHWLSDQGSPPREERSVMPMQAYPWTMLNSSAPWIVHFNSSGTYARHVIRFSLSGIPSNEHLTIKLDDVILDWIPRPGIGIDRWHYDIHRNGSLDAGGHILSFGLSDRALIGKAQLCSVEVIEFGEVEEFNASASYIGAFPTWSETNVTTYRPTNEGCLMRIVTTPNFCQVCVEGLWLELLKRVDLIDSVSLGCSFDTPTTVQRIIEIRLLALAQFREVRTTHKEAYEIIWRRNGAPLPEFTNQTSVYIENTLAILTVDVRFITDEVRIDPHKYLTTSAEIEVSTCTIGSK